MRFLFTPATALLATLAFAGCTSLPRERGYSETGELIKARLGTAPAAFFDDPIPILAPEIPSEPLDIEQAVRLAFLHNPKVRQQYALLGLGRAELATALRLSNPSFGYSRLKPRGGGGAQVTRTVSVLISDLLLLGSRKRFASGELGRLQNSVAAELLNLASDVEVAWFESVSAGQVAAMRELVATSAEQSEALAQRYFDAGNISRLQLEQERAAAAQARIAAVRAGAEALRKRSELASLVGLPVQAAWQTETQLSAPPAFKLTADELVPLALRQRLDLTAAKQAVALREDALGVTRRWRWLGSVELGYEHEREPDGGVIRGPTLAFELPIFNQGQGAVGRAQAELLEARAELDTLALGAQNDAHLGVQRLTVNREISERYRTVLVPSREAIVARSQEQVNFMLIGVFELILAKQHEYDAYQEYLESVRDYWTARAELRRVVGGRLPDDGTALEPTIGVDAVAPSADAPEMDHSMHNMQGMETPSEPTPAATDPHAGHRMSTPAETETVADPHAGHVMPMPEQPESAEPKSSEPEPGKKPAPEPKPEAPAHHHGDSP